MSRTLMFIAAVMVAAPLGTSWACGACDEDKVAATYDHAVVDRARAGHQQVVFVAVDGPVNAAQISRRIAVAATKVPGVVAGTLRTSLSPPAFSFALDEKRRSETAVLDFEKAVGDHLIRLQLVRVVRDGVMAGPK